jgi:hypothetical protein
MRFLTSVSIAHPLAACLALLTGCATMTGTSNQRISVQTFDAQERPIEMRCRVVNGSAEYFGDTPLFDLSVRRSATDLEIECKRGALVARGTAVSRGWTAKAAQVILPGGTASELIDHITGYRYTYPSTLRLRIGQHLVFDASDDAGNGRPVRGMQADVSR